MIVALDKDDDDSDYYRYVEYKILGMLGTFYVEFLSSRMLYKTYRLQGTIILLIVFVGV
jgi:hypothetical protein